MHGEMGKKKEERRKKKESRRKVEGKKKELRRIRSSRVENEIKITIKKGLAVCTTSPTF
jgi:hypothetical protein